MEHRKYHTVYHQNLTIGRTNTELIPFEVLRLYVFHGCRTAAEAVAFDNCMALFAYELASLIRVR